MRQVGLDPARRVDKVNRVVVVLLHSRGNGQDVWVEDDVFRWKSHLVYQNPVSTLADANLVFVSRRLTLLIKSHHHYSGAILQDRPRVEAELLLALLQRDRVHNALTLKAFEAGYD